MNKLYVLPGSLEEFLYPVLSGWIDERKEGRKAVLLSDKITVYQKNLPLPLYLCIQQT